MLTASRRVAPQRRAWGLQPATVRYKLLGQFYGKQAAQSVLLRLEKGQSKHDVKKEFA